MSLTFPRDMTTAYSWAQADLSLRRRQEVSRTAAGTPQTKDLGPPVWVAAFTTIPMPTRDAQALHADFLSLGGALRSFFLAPLPENQPAARVSEALTGVTVSAIGSQNDTIALAGLPDDFVMSPGDFLSITTSVGTELHQLVRGATANSSGVTAAMAVHPHLRPAVQTGQSVLLVNPRVEMILEPGSLRLERLSRLDATVSFQAVQVIR